MCVRVTAAALVLSLAGGGAVLGAQQPGCESCHEQVKTLSSSAHAGVGCLRCHPKYEEYPHPPGLKPAACEQCHAAVVSEQSRSVHEEARRRGDAAAPGCEVCHGGVHEVKRARSAEFYRAVPELCGMCHSEIGEQFLGSAHGTALAKGVREAPVCTTCHGEHSILRHTSRDALVSPSHIPETCGQCHGNVRLMRRFGLPADRLVSFERSFHGLSVRAGSQTVANCASCHGAHAVLPSSDPRSSVHPKNLPATCGNCHPGAGRRFTLGPIHQVEGRGEARAVYWARVFYQILIPLTVGLMLLHNLGDWLRKARLRFQGLAAGARAGAPALRMLPAERIQHALLAVSFILLIWTGFALRYPEHWWARPLLRWESLFPVRGTVHRVAAVVLMGTAVLHVVSLIASRRLRERWKSLWPVRADLAEGLGRLAYNLGLSNRRPLLSEHSYIEKVEYWAVVWGTAVMILSGIIMWANNLVLAWLPKSVLDLAATVHFYEAVLAGLSILVWHIYTVIFDPEVYPMDTAWLTGYSPRVRRSEEPGARPAPEPPAAQPEPEATAEAWPAGQSEPSE